jgi:outer membrane protein TolC
MYIRHTSLRTVRPRAAILSALFGGISALCLPLAVSAQDTDYAVDLIGSAPKTSFQSQKALTRMSSFSELEDALRLHPSLDALNLSAEANRQRAEGALGLPDPVVSLQLNNVPLFDPSFSEYLPSNKAVGIRQALPSRSERKANSLKSLRQADAQDFERDQQFARLRGQLLVYLIEKHSLDVQRDYARERQYKYDELADIIDIEINAGRPLVFRLAQVDVERTEVSRTLAELDGREAQINAELINLLGFIPDTDVPALTRAPWTGNAIAFYGVRVADAAVDVSDADVQRAEADFKPDWGVNLTYQQRESGQGPRSNFDGEDWVSGGVTFSIPLWAGKRQEPNLRAAKTDRNAALARRTAIARQLQSEWSRYDARRETASANIRIIEQKISAIEEQTAAQLISYEAGTGDYSPIIDGEIAILMLRSEIVKEQSLRDQMIAKMNSLLVTS